MRKTNVVAGAAAILLVSGGVAAFAHSGATGIYKERMDGMMAMGKVVKSLSEMMRGDVAYDASAVKDGAKIIESHAGTALTSLFPEGTTEPPSEATDSIWSDWETFEALANQLETYAEGLAAAAENGLAMSGNAQGSMADNGNSMMTGNQKGMMGGGSGMMGTTQPMMTAEQLASMPADGVFTMVAQTCSSCHTKFRLEKK